MLIYQAVAKYLGFDWEEDTVTSCSDNYLNLKLSLDHRSVSISYIGAGAAFLFSLISVIIIGVAGCRFRQKNLQIEKGEEDTNPLQKNAGKMELVLYD